MKKLKIQQLARKFAFKSLELPDPNPSLTPEQVKQVYSQQYPELTNASIEGPVTEGTTQKFTFTPVLGSKG